MKRLIETFLGCAWAWWKFLHLSAVCCLILSFVMIAHVLGSFNAFMILAIIFVGCTVFAVVRVSFLDDEIIESTAEKLEQEKLEVGWKTRNFRLAWNRFLGRKA